MDYLTSVLLGPLRERQRTLSDPSKSSVEEFSLEDLSTPGQGQGEGPDDSESERGEDDDGVGRGRSERSERSSDRG